MNAFNSLDLIFGVPLDLDLIPESHPETGAKYYDYTSYQKYLQSLIHQPIVIRIVGDVKKDTQLMYYLSLPIPNGLNIMGLSQWLTHVHELYPTFSESLKGLGHRPVPLEDLQLLPGSTYC